MIQYKKFNDSMFYRHDTETKQTIRVVTNKFGMSAEVVRLKFRPDRFDDKFDYFDSSEKEFKRAFNSVIRLLKDEIR